MSKLFSLRKDIFNNENPVDTNDTSLNTIFNTSTSNERILTGSGSSHLNFSKLLTENSDFKIFQLPSFNNTTIDELNTISDATVDPSCNRSFIHGRDSLYYWDLNSKAASHNLSKISLSSATNCLFVCPPTVLDFNPLSTLSNVMSPGLVAVIDNYSRLVYYEDIDLINNLSPELLKLKAHYLPLYLKDTENVTSIISCEPAGVVLSTSLNRVIFITLKDSNGNIDLKIQKQLLNPPNFLSKFHAKGDIVSLQKGPIIGKGECLLFITTSSGYFITWQLSLLQENCFKICESNFYNNISSYLSNSYPRATSTLKILASSLIDHHSPNYQIILSSVEDDDSTNARVHYTLSFIDVDNDTNVSTLLSTYTLNTYTTPITDFGFNPKIYVPSLLSENGSDNPLLSIFVVFSNATVLVKRNSALDLRFQKNSEDIISFRDDLQIIASNCNSKSLYMMNTEFNTIKVDLLPVDEQQINDSRFIKSHIDQSIYFSNTSSFENPINFSIPEMISLSHELDDIEHDIFLVNDDIFYSKSKYIPPFDNSLEDNLSQRITFYQNFLYFIKSNFDFIVSPTTKLSLIESYQIMKSCKSFLHSIHNNSDNSFSQTWNKVLKQKNITEKELVLYKLNEYPNLLTNFFLTLIDVNDETKSTYSQEFISQIVDLIISALYQSVLEEGEKSMRYELFNLDNKELNESLPWFITDKNCQFINKVVFEYKFSLKSIQNADFKIVERVNAQFLSLIKLLYYLTSQAKLWFNINEDVSILPAFDKNLLTSFFNEDHLLWNQILCELDLKNEALQVSEFYGDLESLVQILNSIEKGIISEDDKIQVKNIYNQYFLQFGYPFASLLFKSYINNHNLTDLFFKFPEQENYRISFFAEYPEYAEVAWIQEIKDNKFNKASNTLLNFTLGANGMNSKIDDRQLYLNIAKLSSLVDFDKGNGGQISNVELKKLRLIQENLDILDGEKDLSVKLKNDRVHLNNRYKGTKLQEFFDSNCKMLVRKISLIPEVIVEIYSMLDDAESFFHALKILASFDTDAVPYEKLQMLVSLTWRRCILLSYEKSREKEEESTTNSSILYNVLTRYFTDELYNAGIPLPSLAIIGDKSIIESAYCANAYDMFITTTAEAANFQQLLKSEYNTLDSLSNDLKNTIKTVVGHANKDTGDKCRVNYELLSVE